jgi:type IV secretion system protein VirB4
VGEVTNHHAIPVLTYLFHRIEQRLDGRPTLIVIDETWVVLANSTFGAKLEEWLRTLRKKRCSRRTRPRGGKGLGLGTMMFPAAHT